MNRTESETRLDEFLAFLNSSYPPIEWTMEFRKGTRRKVSRHGISVICKLDNQHINMSYRHPILDLVDLKIEHLVGILDLFS